MTAPTTPVHADAGATKKAAAKRASRFAESLEGRVLAAVVRADFMAYVATADGRARAAAQLGGAA